MNIACDMLIYFMSPFLRTLNFHKSYEECAFIFVDNLQQT